jgi:hypothetical protein
MLFPCVAAGSRPGHRWGGAAALHQPGVGLLMAIVIGALAGWLAERFMNSNMGLLGNIEALGQPSRQRPDDDGHQEADARLPERSVHVTVHAVPLCRTPSMPGPRTGGDTGEQHGRSRVRSARAAGRRPPALHQAGLGGRCEI